MPHGRAEGRARALWLPGPTVCEGLCKGRAGSIAARPAQTARTTSVRSRERTRAARPGPLAAIGAAECARLPARRRMIAGT